MSTILKKKRKAISLEMKIQILDFLQKGDSFASLAKTFRINESTVRTIKKNELTVRRSVVSGSLISSKYTSYVRDPMMEKLEKALMIWIEDHTQKRIPIDTNAIKEKAKKIYKFLSENNQSTLSDEKKQDFTASKGWLERFKNRYSLHNLKIKGEAASADENAAKLFLPQFLKIVNENCYSPHQVFNADETGLNWKKMPSRTFIAKSEKTASGFKAAKDRVTLMFCGNASGDCMMKPLLINRALKPRAMKGVDMKNLPVHWMSNKKAWMTALIFKQWFNDCFIPEAESYLKKKNLPFKVLLLLDNAPGHPQNIHHPNVEIIFLPPNTTSLIQPLDQGMISTFKSYYIKRSYEEILNQIDRNASLTILKAWKNFTILDCVKYIGLANKEIKKSTLNACWRAVWPEVVEPDHIIPARDETFNNILTITNALGQGLENLEFSDIDELFVNDEID